MKAHSPNHQHDPKTKQIFEFLPGPVKIKDGLFMGDEIAARDIEFIISNKVTHVINTVSKQIPNLWERFGIHYLSVNWTDKEENIFDKKNNAINTIFHFIEEAMEQGESCLIHSINAKSRSCAVTTAYLMKKYSWSLNKCLEFISSKKENFEVRNNYLLQLQELEERMGKIYKLSSDWSNSKNDEQLLLVNTFLNAKSAKNVNNQHHAPQTVVKDAQKRVNWAEKPTVHKMGTTATKMTRESITINKKITPQSILKGFKDQSNDTNSQTNFEESEDYNSRYGHKDGPLASNSLNANSGAITTINNFLASDKKPSPQRTAVNSRPYSSDQKDRQKEKRAQTGIINQKKILPYDPTSFSSYSYKTAYQQKPISQVRAGSSGKALKPKKEQPEKAASSGGYDRPQSAKHRAPVGYQMAGKDDFVIINGSSFSQGFHKKRYPSNPREALFKRK